MFFLGGGLIKVHLFYYYLYMKTIKEYLSEGLIRRQAGMDIKAKIEVWLKEYKVREYKINSDLTIDVEGDFVYLQKYQDKELPKYIQFNRVDGCFDISKSNITSLKGCPKECQAFYCCNCNNLTSLEDAPKECKIVWCSGCENLSSLEGSPRHCRTFWCNSCNNLTTLKGAPEKCDEFKCMGCENLSSLEGAPKECIDFWCNGRNNLTSLEGAPKKCREFYCRDCKGNFTKEDVRKVCNAKKIHC